MGLNVLHEDGVFQEFVSHICTLVFKSDILPNTSKFT